jgi:NAD dependent epimerase/dehydratase family enzyme
MTPIFKVGPGAPIGSGGGLFAKGQQWMSWVHIDDIAGIFRLAVENADASGPINGTAPDPVRNAEFSKTLSSVLRKPHTFWRFFVPIGPPDVMIQLMLGEVAGVITAGQKVLPKRAQALGYYYKFPYLADALRDVCLPKQVATPTSPKPVAAGTASHH